MTAVLEAAEGPVWCGVCCAASGSSLVFPAALGSCAHCSGCRETQQVVLYNCLLLSGFLCEIMHLIKLLPKGCVQDAVSGLSSSLF